MSFCHVIVVLATFSPPGELPYNTLRGAANCSFETQAECLTSVKTYPTGKQMENGDLFLTSFCSPPVRLQDSPPPAQPDVKNKRAL